MPNPIIRIPVDQFQLGEQASRTVDLEVTDPTFKAVHTLPSASGKLLGTGEQTLTPAEKAQARANIGAGTGGGGSGGGAWGEITGTLSDQTDLQSALDAKAAASALTTHTSNTSNPHSVTASQVGLGNVNNTSDAAKPVSTAQQTALDLKANLASPALTGTPTAPTAAADTSTTQIATTAFAKAEADAAQAFAIQRANHTGSQTASTISDFNSATRAQTEAELIAGTNVTITPGSSGATRTLTISASGGSGGGDVSVTGTPVSGQIAEWTSATAIQGKAVTGSGNVVLATSPTLVTPALGTPSAAVLTNATGLPVASGISGLGTGIATALAVNVGTAGAPVVNGGALGTPSSGTVTNLTGTASININGTVGATTPNSGAFTAVTANATSTFSGLLSATSPGVALGISGGGTSAQYQRFNTTGGNYYVGVSDSTGGGLLTGVGNYGFAILSESNRNVGIGVNNTLVALYTSTGLNNTAIGATTAAAGRFTNTTFPEASAPSTPASGNVVLYAKSDGLLYSKDDAGTETLVSGGAGGGGGGSGTKTYAVFTPLMNQPPASNFATLDTRNSEAVLDFDDTTEESAVFVGVIPEAASLGSGLIVRITWMATSATSGNVRWGVQFEKYGTDQDSDSFDTATEAHTATSGTSGIEVVTAITCTTIDSLAAGDKFRLKIYRDVSDTTNDTMTGDAEITAVELRSAA